MQRLLPVGRCLSVISGHFVETWKEDVRPPRTRCSHAAAHAHHVEFGPAAAATRLETLVAMCGFHHLRGVHGGYLRVVGRAPDALTWFLNGEVWAASVGAQCAA